MPADRDAASVVVRAMAVAVAAIGALVLVGWAADVPLLTRGARQWVSTKPETAVCLVAVAVGLWLLTGRHQRLAAAPAGLVAVVAVGTLVEYVLGTDLGIDRLLGHVSEPGPSPGRMAALTAVALLLLAVGLATVAFDHPLVMQVGALTAFATGYVAVLGYVFDARSLYSVGGYKAMALPTAVALAVAAVGLLATRPDRGCVALLTGSGSAERLTRRVVPALLLGAGALGALVVAGERAGAYRPRFGTALLALAIVTVGVGVAWRAAIVIGRAERAEQAAAATAAANAAELGALTERLQAQVSTLVETAPDAIVTVAADGRITAANQHAADMFGYRLEELVGRVVEDIVPERLRDRHTANRAGFLTTPRLRPMGPDLTLVARRADGSEFPVAVSLAPLPADPDAAVLATVRDLTDVRAAEAAAAQSAHRFAAAFDDAPVGMLLVDLDGRIRQVNGALATMLEVDAAALTGHDLLVLLDPRDVDEDTVQRADLLAGRVHSYQREVRLLNGDGEPVWALVSTALVPDVTGQPAHLVLHVEDVRDRKHFEGRLQYLADHDPLTGLYNRRRFDQELSQHLAERARYGGTAAVLLLDLDSFKDVNDTLGHSTGDALIRAVASSLQHRIREADVLARLGGDEFAVLLPSADVDEAQSVAAALLDAVRTDGATTDRGTVRARTTASIGIAMLTDDARQPSSEALLAAADLAMYAAKEEGRDRAVVYDPSGPHLARAQARFRWIERIHAALEQDLFTLHAQPIVDTAGGQVSQLELLLRMRDGDTLIPPGQFLDIAERHGLGPAIDRWVIRAAIGYAATLTDPDAPKIDVNVCAASLADPDLPAAIAELLAEHQVAPNRLVFEVTETAAIANIDTARVFVEQLSELGCAFALDDFGAGFGSFYYLKYLPFDYLKIDGEFIRQLTSSRTDYLIVSSIVSAARGLGKKTVAEYVGDADTLALVRSLGVDYAQGYHLGRPTALTAATLPA